MLTLAVDNTLEWADFSRDSDVREEIDTSEVPRGYFDAPMFVDWITVAQVHDEPGLKKISDGCVISRDADGVIEWEVDKDFTFEGSHDSRIKVQCDGQTVRLSGNVGRFDRPDNVFGFDLDQVMQKANKILERLELPPFTKGKVFRYYGYEFNQWTGAFFTRLDLTSNFMTGSSENVAPFMQHLAAQSVSRMRTGAFPDGMTVDYGRGSKYWYAKAYAKYNQLTSRSQKKRSPSSDVLDFVRDVGMVRFEFTAKSRFLYQNGLRFWGGCSMAILRKIFNDKSDVIRRERAGYQSFDQLFDGLQGASLRVALDWKVGKDISSGCSRATYYKHRKTILDHCGIDISMPCNVVDLQTRIKIKEITVMPMIAPDWYWKKTGTGI